MTSCCHEIPWLFPDFFQNFKFPWLKSKFPDFSLTLNFFHFSLTFPWPWEPCYIPFLKTVLIQVSWWYSYTDYILLIRDFPRPDIGPNIGPSRIQRWAKTSQNGVYHSQYLSSTFWWTFHKNRSKNSKVTDVWKFVQKCEWKRVFILIFMQRTCNGFVLQMAHFYSKKSIVKKSLLNITKWYLRVSSLMSTIYFLH